MEAERPQTSVHVSTARTWRGGENQIFLLCQGLQARGQRAVIVTPPGAPLQERATRAGLETHELSLGQGLNPLGVIRLGKLLRKVQADVLHLHDSHAVLPGKMAARALPRERLSVVAHRRTVFTIKSASKYGGRVDQVVAISAATRAELERAGIASTRISVIYSGLAFPEPLGRDAPEARALRDEMGLAEDSLLIAHAAALTSEKRQMDLLAAAETLGEHVHLAIAGSGELEGQLKEEISRRGLGARVHLLGFRQDLRALWAAADMAAFCSEAEGLCTALIEAQGAGLPAAITRAGGMVEVVEDGLTGLSVPVGDVAALAAALGRLAGDSGLRRRFGEAARVRARERFSAEAMTEGTLALYRRLRASERGTGLEA
ncbi:MAG: glycosyltransferase [Planctomycetota bacterium]|nr:glycosyltransferase [Planctomycetota bacterium]